MLKPLRTIAVAVTLSIAAGAASAQPLTEIKVSYQPALYWSLPFYVASQKGWWAELGLKPEYSVFPAACRRSPRPREVVGRRRHGLGARGPRRARYNLLTIGSPTTSRSAMRCSQAGQGRRLPQESGFDQGPDDRAHRELDRRLRGAVVPRQVGPQEGRRDDQEHGPGEIISAMSSNNADLGGLWAPNIYTLEEKAGAKVICSGKDAGAIVPARSSCAPSTRRSSRRTSPSSSRSTFARGSG
jgi:NitT/TauT family transport system substrate-binding protein